MTKNVNENEALLACPFCGGEAYSENYIVDGCVRCKRCQSTIIYKNKKNDDSGMRKAIQIWNSRIGVNNE